MRGDSDFDPEDFDPRGLWQAQTKEHDAMTLATIHQKARAFDRKIQWRNAREHFACGLALALFAPALFLPFHWLMKAGAAWVMLAVLYVAWQLQRRASNEGMPLPGENLVDAYRRQLVRQRDALRSVGSWYIGPMIPGLVLVQAGMWLTPPKHGVPIERAHAGQLVSAAVVAAVFGGVWWLNQRGARQLQKRIDEL